MKSMKSGGNHYLLTCYLWLYRSDIVFLAIQHKGGGLTELLVMALCLALIIIYLIIIFSILLNIAPDIADLVFYCECFLIIFLLAHPFISC